MSRPTLTPADPEAGLWMMPEQGLRRLPIVDGVRPVGIVTIGDLAIERDPELTVADKRGSTNN